MALVPRRNPTTGQVEFIEDGQVSPSLFPPKPENETTISRPIVSQESRQALQQRDLATGEVLNAQEQLGGVEQETATQQAPIAKEKTDYLQQQQDDAEARRVAREAQKSRHLLGREDDIKKEAAAQVRAGNAKEDLLGDGWGAFLAALLTGVGTAAHLFQGGSGPSPAERVLDKRIGQQKEKLMAEWEGLKSTRELKDRDHDAYLQAQRDQEDDVSKSIQKQLAVYDARVEQVAAKMAPEKQAALTRLSKATTEQLAAKEKADDSKRFDARMESTNRSASGRPGANPEAKPYSNDTAEIVDAADQYAVLAKRQEEIINKLGGVFPIDKVFADPKQAELATEFEKNDRVMQNHLQKPLGKSDNDAKLAAGMQGKPGPVEKLASRLPGTNTVSNYLASLKTNSATLRRSADNRIAMERKGNPGLPGAPTSKPAEASKAQPSASENGKPQPLSKEDAAELRGLKDADLEKLKAHRDPAIAEAASGVLRERTSRTATRPIDRR